MGSAPDTAPRAQAASAPAILNRAAWPELPKEPATPGMLPASIHFKEYNVIGEVTESGLGDMLQKRPTFKCIPQNSIKIALNVSFHRRL